MKARRVTVRDGSRRFPVVTWPACVSHRDSVRDPASALFGMMPPDASAERSDATPAELPPLEDEGPTPPASRYGHRPTAIPSEHSAELEAFRDVAQRLAAGVDSATVLRVLCEVAMDQGRASGAMVAELYADSGSFVAGAGLVADLAGGSFPLAGSITARVVAERRAIAVETMRESSPFFESLLGRRGIGPTLVVPLAANDEFLGVLIVTRRVDTPVFTTAAAARLSTVADLAALGLWKARLLEEARAADSAKTAVLATLSHELRTPMTALEGYGELLEDEILGTLTPAQRDVLTNLRSVGRHLGALIEEILTFASLEADRVVPRRSVVPVDEMLDALHPVLAPLAREKGITLQLLPHPAITAIHTDPERVRQILLNLSANAIKFTDTGRVTLSVLPGVPLSDGRRTVRFDVEDTGVGIAAADLARLFQPFSQVDPSPTRRHSGTGLGLYISRRLAELLGGYVDVASQPGKGSRFSLIIPRGESPKSSGSG